MMTRRAWGASFVGVAMLISCGLSLGGDQTLALVTQPLSAQDLQDLADALDAVYAAKRQLQLLLCYASLKSDGDTRVSSDQARRQEAQLLSTELSKRTLTPVGSDYSSRMKQVIITSAAAKRLSLPVFQKHQLNTTPRLSMPPTIPYQLGGRSTPTMHSFVKTPNNPRVIKISPRPPKAKTTEN